MCLMLYVATAGDQPCFETSTLHVEPVPPSRSAVTQWFTLPVVRFVGAHTGCSCGFRHVLAEEPFDYYDGMFDDDAEKEASVTALIDMVRGFAARDGRVELLPVWEGDEAEPPKGAIDRDVETLDPAHWFFIERFLYRVSTRQDVS
jgi:hypothetical protein